MARKPTPAEAQLLAVYQDAEAAILAQVTRSTGLTLGAVAQGRDPEAVRREVAARLRQAVAQLLAGTGRKARAKVDAIMAAAYGLGIREALDELGAIGGAGPEGLYDPSIDRGAIARLAAAVLDLLTPAHHTVLRTTDDVYRQVTARVVPGMLVGADTRRDATQRALWHYADRGITGFQDRAGRNWTLSAYAEMAVRTASARATEDAKHDRLRKAGVDLVIVQGSADRCPKCRPWAGKILTLGAVGGARTAQVEHATRDGELVDVHIAGTVEEARAAGWNHPQCFPGEVLAASPSDVTGSYARRYEGELVVIHTALGDELPVTPNHPVLTPEGWVAAGALKVGDRLVRYPVGEQRVNSLRPGVRPSDELIPAPIGEVHEALRQSSGVRTVRVPGSAEQFHGDGRGGDVEVVLADGLLRDSLDASNEHGLGDGPLVVSRSMPHALVVPSAGFEACERHSGAPDGFVRLGGVLLPLLGRHRSHAPAVGPAEVEGVAAGDETPCDDRTGSTNAGRDLGLSEPFAVQADGLVNPEPGVALAGDAPFAELPIEGPVTDANGGRDLARALTGEVAPDHVVEIEVRREWSGHVYNLETVDGWYTVASGIVVHNCRCSTAIYLPGVTTIPKPVPAEGNGQYEARQRQRAIERGIRHAKAREAAALDDPARKDARVQVRAWQARMREHLKDNPDLLRRSYREQVGTGNLPTDRTRAEGDRGVPNPAGQRRGPADMTDVELDRELERAITETRRDELRVEVAQRAARVARSRRAARRR